MSQDVGVTFAKQPPIFQEVAAEAVYAMRRNGSEFEPFIPLVASGINTSMFERVAADKVIRAGEMVTFDLGAVLKGYAADLDVPDITPGE